MDTKVHILAHGYALCGFSQAVPRDWPEGHQFVLIEDKTLATCNGCKTGADQYLTSLKDSIPAGQASPL